jgi:hypothetical protein
MLRATAETDVNKIVGTVKSISGWKMFSKTKKTPEFFSM